MASAKPIYNTDIALSLPFEARLRLEPVSEFDQIYIKTPKFWEHVGGLQINFQAKQEFECVTLASISPLAAALQRGSIDGMVDFHALLEKQSFDVIPAAAIDGNGRHFNLLEMAIVMESKRGLPVVLSCLNLDAPDMARQLGDTLTSAHQFFHRRHHATLRGGYMSVDSVFTKRLIGLVAAGAMVDKGYWGRQEELLREFDGRGRFQRGDDRWTEIAYAAVGGSDDSFASPAINHLARQGYPIDVPEESGQISLLHLACMRGLSKTVDTLLTLGADPHQKTKNHWDAWSYAKKGSQKRILQLLDAWEVKRAINDVIPHHRP